MVAMTLVLPIDPEANRLLERSPLALLLGMVLDQQVPMEKAFSSPYVLVQRLGHDLDAAELAGYDPEALLALFATPPALHRFPKAMAARVQEVCQVLVDRYDGDAARLWNDATDGPELLRRVAELPGFGKQKAQIFVALLGKRFGVTPQDWRQAAGGYGDPGAYRSVADVTDVDSLRQVREYKQQMKAAAKAKAAGA
ncbi:HhH-GPD-type base excision DNA repair protein [Micromonospora vulcania]|uniref:HhH-GPD-type base excision DNA repair protein n=1 Tax=Micromonospora vulcania TaxID=1441873 RepID=A0ABW1H0C0_9ACTN